MFESDRRETYILAGELVFFYQENFLSKKDNFGKLKNLHN